MFLLSVCLSVGNDHVLCKNEWDAFELSFGLVGRVGSRDSVLDGAQPPPHWKRQIFGKWGSTMLRIGRMWHCAVKVAWFAAD